MPLPPIPRPPRIPLNDLHRAATLGSTERTLAVLSRGVVDIDEGGLDLDGYTPLMVACYRGNSGVVEILLNKGASTSAVNSPGFYALHMAVREGHLAVTNLLLKAGADLCTTIIEAKTYSLLVQAAHRFP